MEHKTEAAKLRTAWAHNAAQNMLDVISAITKRAKLITGISLGASMPHQIVYLIALCLPHMHLATSGLAPIQVVSNYLDALGMIVVAVAVPIGSDIAIYSCIDTLGAQAATKKSKVRSFIFMIIPLIASGFVNFLAPAPMILKGLAAFLVFLVIIAQGLKFIETDWDKLEKFESENVVIVDDEEAPARTRRVVTERERRQREKDCYAAMTKTEQYKWRMQWDANEQKRLAKLTKLQSQVTETDDALVG